MSIPAQWTALENAIHAWAVAGSGLAADRVQWSQQPAPQPAAAWISIRALALRGLGHDGARVTDNPTPTVGNEIITTAYGWHELTLIMQCFAAAPHGATSSMARLEGVRAAARLPNRRAALNAAGLGILGFDPVTSLDHLRGAIFEPRAILTVRCNLVSEVTELGTFIEFVEIERLAPAPAVVTFVPSEPL